MIPIWKHLHIRYGCQVSTTWKMAIISFLIGGHAQAFVNCINIAPTPLPDAPHSKRNWALVKWVHCTWLPLTLKRPTRKHRSIQKALVFKAEKAYSTTSFQSHWQYLTRSRNDYCVHGRISTMVRTSIEQGLNLNEGHVTYPLSLTSINNGNNNRDEINELRVHHVTYPLSLMEMNNKKNNKAGINKLRVNINSKNNVRMKLRNCEQISSSTTRMI